MMAGSDGAGGVGHSRKEETGAKVPTWLINRQLLSAGDTRRARYLYTLLFERIETPDGLCAHDTPGWEGCPQARQEFSYPKRLGQIIVSAGIQGGDLVLFLTSY